VGGSSEGIPPPASCNSGAQAARLNDAAYPRSSIDKGLLSVDQYAAKKPADQMEIDHEPCQRSDSFQELVGSEAHELSDAIIIIIVFIK